MRPWTSSQRVAVAVLIGVILSVVIVRWRLNPAYIADPQPEHPSRESELADRIDLNTADAATLSALPLIGDRKARDIVAYRERHLAKNADQPAFRELNDLLRIKGIGAATTAQLEPYLTFPGK